MLPDHSTAGDITLRRRRLSDLADLRAAIELSIDELSAFLSWAGDGVPSTADLEAAVIARDEAFVSGGGFGYVVRETATNELVGEVGGEIGADGISAEIGYWVRTDRAGRGYATAAAAALTSLVFEAFAPIERVEIRMDKGNVRSRAVPERLGFSLVGEEAFDTPPLVGQTGEGLIWQITRAQWRASHS